MTNNSDHQEDLEQFLKSIPEFTQESQVVYFLCTIRKILEKEKKYRDLKFYCNWALHSGLDWGSTIKTLSSKFDTLDFSKNRKEIQSAIARLDGGKFIKMHDFRSELMQFLDNRNLSKDCIDGNNKWCKFTKLYLEIIHKCPIDGTSPGVSGLHLSKEKDGYYYEFYINKTMRISRIKLKLKK